MSPVRNARMLARYNAWANRLTFDAVAALPEGEAEKPRQYVFRNMLHTLNHNYVIGRIFQAHLERREHGYTARNTEDYPPLHELRRSQEALDAWYVGLSDRLDPAAFDDVLRFTFVGGGDGAMSRGEILQHIVNHNTYHRGSVAMMIYQVPARPPATDLPVFLRDVPQLPA